MTTPSESPDAPLFDQVTPEAPANEVVCSAESFRRWLKHGDDADIPKDERDRIVRFMESLLGMTTCFYIGEGPRPRPPLDPKEERRRRLEERAAIRARAAAPRLLTYTKN